MIRKFALMVALMMVVPHTPASASVALENIMTTTSTPTGQGLGVYQYKTGVQAAADFASGTHTGTVDSGGSLELAPGAADWWDTNWLRRQCFDVTSPSAVSEYPVRFEVDTSAGGSTGADVRVVVGTDGAQLQSFSEGPFVSTASVVFAKVAPLPAGTSSYCVYFDNPAAATVSDETAVFTPLAPQVMRYYTMLNTYNNTNLQVVSYTANNTVSDGTSTVVLGVGGTHTFTGANRNTVITATGPIEGSADVNGTESIVPESFAHNDFVYAVNRGTNGIWLRAPFGGTTIEASVNGTVVNSVAIGPASGAVFLQANFGNNQTLRVRSTDGTDFLGIFKSTANNDVGLAVHNYGDPIFGVRSRWILTAANGTANVNFSGSDGSNVNATVAPNSPESINSGSDSRGNGTAFRVTSDGPPISAYQYADQNGSEVTALYPTRKLAKTWITPIASRYVTVACPTVPTTVTIGGTNFNCTGPAGGPGFAYGGLTGRPAGTVITADNPIYVYYESQANSDEHNLLGIRAGATPYLPGGGPAITAQAVEVLAGRCGEWVSDPIAVAGVFGQADILETVPPEGTVTYQISTDGSGFYGPDGTAATSFAQDDIVPYLADFASTLSLRIELCSTDPVITPSVDSFSVDTDLVELVGDEGVTSGITLASTGTNSEPVVRVYQHTPGGWNGSVVYADGVNLGALTADFGTDHPTVQVSVAGGVPSSPSPAFSHTTAEPYTLSIDHATAAGQVAEVELDLVDIGQVKMENSLRVTFTG